MVNGHPSKEKKGVRKTIRALLSPSSSNSPSQLNADDQMRSSNWRQKFSSKSSNAPTQSSSLLPPNVREDLTREIILNHSVVTLQNAAPQIVASQAMDTESSGSPLPVTSPAAEDQNDSTTQQGPTITVSSTQSLEPTSVVAETRAGSLGSPPPNTLSTARDSLKVAGRFIQTLMMKAPQIFDTNPAKMALGLAKTIIEIKRGVEDNMDTVERRIASVAAQLDTVAKALDGWRLVSRDEKQCVDRFKMYYHPFLEGSKLTRIQLFRVLIEEFAKLHQLSEEWIGRKVADYEDEKSRIAEIFERVNDARVQFGLETDLRIFKAIHAIEEGHRRSLLKDLQPSDLAHHKYHLEGEKKEKLRRVICTPGTRECLLKDIVTWAREPSSETLYWLFGAAGTGKSTIAYTIARRFELATDYDTVVLGGNFFCSRQFAETRFATPIIRTIVYHLALRCKAFADALSHSGRFDTVNENVRAQLEGLLIGPWQASESERLSDSPTAPQYLIVIDALDEIDGNGGPEFLRNLLNVINENHLKGLKFFATSRPDPELVSHVGCFQDKQLYRLEEVPLKEAQADIRTYLNTGLPHVQHEVIEKLVTAAAGLFIYAATVIKYLGNHSPQEQKKLLKKLLSVSNNTTQMLPGVTALLDELYIQVLLDAFGSFEGDILLHRLQILFTILCTPVRTSMTIVAKLLLNDDSDSDSDCASAAETNLAVCETSIADDVIQCLHAVLYTRNNKVFWHHKSFPDFLFDQNWSRNFWCNQAEHHRLLTNSCFQVMKEGLRFNIANIPSSFILDNENATLLDEVEKEIPPILQYSCQNWDYHLSFTKSTTSDPLLDILSKYLQLPVLFWIEAMNLIGSHGLCDPMLQTAC
ncbi:hypothetical protein C0991_011135 [Blastosporella zonata]|nr:hypothetical protein C0991_011135 [Blastosporella zonata]